MGYYFKFIEFERLCHSQQCHHTRGKLVPVCVCIIVQTRQFSAMHFVCFREKILILKLLQHIKHTVTNRRAVFSCFVYNLRRRCCIYGSRNTE